jgi:hypothetical protein
MASDLTANIDSAIFCITQCFTCLGGVQSPKFLEHPRIAYPFISIALVSALSLCRVRRHWCTLETATTIAAIWLKDASDSNDSTNEGAWKVSRTYTYIIKMKTASAIFVTIKPWLTARKHAPGCLVMIALL